MKSGPTGWGLSSQLLQRLRQPKNTKFRLQSEFRASVGNLRGSYLRVKSENETNVSHGEQERDTRFSPPAPQPKMKRGSNTQLMSPESSAGRGRKWRTKGSVSTSAQGKRGASGKVTEEAWDRGRKSGGRVRKVARSLLH